MKLRLAILPLALAAIAPAQSSLPITSLGTQYIWVPPPTNVTFFFDLTVATTVTMQGVNFTTLSPVGTAGTAQMWLTNPGITTYLGNEAIAANWTLATSGPLTVPPAPNAVGACFTNGLVLQPGTYGVAITAQNLQNLFASNGSPQTFANAELSVSLGATSYNGFTGGALANYVFLGTLNYAIGAVPHGCATRVTTGRGCNAATGSFYQAWTTSAAAAGALNGRSLSLVNTGVSYVLTQGTATYLAPSAGATALPTNNNGESTITLPSTFFYPGGTTTQLSIATDGHVSTTANLTLPGTQSYSPYPPGLLDSPNPMWAVCWHNFNTAETNSGVIKWEIVGNLVVITWDGVENWPGVLNAVQTVNPSRFQAQFDLSTGAVHYVYVTLDTLGGSQYFDRTVVGWSPAGPSPDVGPVDVTTVTALALASTEVLPLTLTATTPPVLGANVDLVTSNEAPASLGINFVSTTALPAPGISLATIGAPGCFALIDTTAAVGNLITNLGAPLPGMTITLPIPNNPALLGFVVASQSVFLDPAANAFGLTASNAVTLTIGTFAP